MHPPRGIIVSSLAVRHQAVVMTTSIILKPTCSPGNTTCGLNSKIVKTSAWPPHWQLPSTTIRFAMSATTDIMCVSTVSTRSVGEPWRYHNGLIPSTHEVFLHRIAILPRNATRTSPVKRQHPPRMATFCGPHPLTLSHQGSILHRTATMLQTVISGHITSHQAVINLDLQGFFAKAVHAGHQRIAEITAQERERSLSITSTTPRAVITTASWPRCALSPIWSDVRLQTSPDPCHRR